MKKFLLFSMLSGLIAQMAMGVATNPVGYMSITCPANSDTIVGLPLRQNAAFSGTISATPDTTTTPGSAILTLSGTPGLTINAYANNYYVKFADTTPAAAGDGQWFSITANAAGTITVTLNGGTIAAVSGARLEVLKFWTLAELFNPALSTTDPATTGNAIVASLSQLPAGRRTEILIPDLVSQGINLAPSLTFYVNAGIWKKQGGGATSYNTQVLWPDNYVIVRHPVAVTSATTYTVTGEVEMNSFSIPLSTQTAVSQDNFIAIPRPVGVSLNNLHLAGTSAFISSNGQLPAQRRDEVLLFDNVSQAANKAPVTTYYHHAGIWKKQGGGAVDFGADLIPAGVGFIIRKYPTTGGETLFWNNTSSY